jgi:hypothetical protein
LSRRGGARRCNRWNRRLGYRLALRPVFALKVLPRSSCDVERADAPQRLALSGFELRPESIRIAPPRFGREPEEHPQRDSGERPRADRSERQEDDAEAPEDTPDCGSCETRGGADARGGSVRRCFAISDSLSRDTTAARSPASAFRNSPPACRLRLPSAGEFASTEPTCSLPSFLIPVCGSLGVSDMRAQAHQSGS